MPRLLLQIYECIVWIVCIKSCKQLFTLISFNRTIRFVLNKNKRFQQSKIVYKTKLDVFVCVFYTWKELRYYKLILQRSKKWKSREKNSKLCQWHIFSNYCEIFWGQPCKNISASITNKTHKLLVDVLIHSHRHDCEYGKHRLLLNRWLRTKLLFAALLISFRILSLLLLNPYADKQTYASHRSSKCTMTF